jgi:hypothetical protein
MVASAIEADATIHLALGAATLPGAKALGSRAAAP